MREQIRNATISTATIVEPTGGPNKIAIKSPNVAHTTDNTTEQMVTDKKLLKIRIADNAGKSLADAIRCWKYKKKLPGHNRYEKSDLSALTGGKEP